MALCLLAEAFLLTLQEVLGEGALDHPAPGPQVCHVVRTMLPRERFGPQELLLWPDGVQSSNKRAWYSHEKRRAT